MPGKRQKASRNDPAAIGMAWELQLDRYNIPKNLVPVLENNVNRHSVTLGNKSNYLSVLESLVNTEELNPTTYMCYLRLLLYLEEHERWEEWRKYDLINQTIRRHEGKDTFFVRVPGLEDERPPLNLYNEMEIRKSDNTFCGKFEVTFMGKNYVEVEPCPGSLKVSRQYKDHWKYNIAFLLPRRTFQCSHLALDYIHFNELIPSMFPKVKTCYNKLSKELSWFNENIANNAEQKQAVNNIVARTAHPAPYIVFGPPGTGKTATLVEAITQIWNNSPSNHILICTASNASADEVVKRLLKNIPERDIYRMYGTARKWDEVDEEIRPCSNFIDGEIIFLPKELIVLRRIVVVTLVTCARLLALHLRENHFSYVFIDEAGQATELESLIPLGLMSNTDTGHRGRLQGQLVIAGDPMQLGPQVAVKIVDILEKSMLERLMQCEPYKKDDSGKYNPQYITKLLRNFRSNKFILHVPNNLFYDGELIACGKNKDINRAMRSKLLPNKSFPLIFHGVVGDESHELNSPSVYNTFEINVIIKYLEKLIDAKFGDRKLIQKDIGIITPYRLQRMKIQEAIEARNWNDVTVGTVEVFQGQERDVIILSTVRSRIFFRRGKEPLGHLSNFKRFNVAVTRAKSLLITIGNPRVLNYYKCWKELKSYCFKNKAWIGERALGKMTEAEKRNLIAEKFIPQQEAMEDIPFPDVKRSTVTNRELIGRFRTIRKYRLPKKNLVQYENNSGIRSASNCSSTTDSDQQNRINKVSNTDGDLSLSNDDCISYISAASDEPLCSISENARNSDIFPTTSFVARNMMQQIRDDHSEDSEDTTDNSEVSSITSEEEEKTEEEGEEGTGNLPLGLDKLSLCDI